jgi:lipopolysaccharide transport system ATP-binding protein
VAFAEVERFLDTPVKRYSSGMYVRLAFAVAAHLEPEILVVDEVLAVGDAEFQKKCLGKMQDVATGGRTVLFVSHNMAAVKSLTGKGLVLNQGKLEYFGPTEKAVEIYVSFSAKTEKLQKINNWGSGKHTKIIDVHLLDQENKNTVQYTPGEPINLRISFETDGQAGMSLEVFMADSFRNRIGMASLYQFHGRSLPAKKGKFECHIELKPQWLASGRYSFDVATSAINVGWDHFVDSALEIDVPYSNPTNREYDFKQSYGYGSLALLTSNICIK